MYFKIWLNNLCWTIRYDVDNRNWKRSKECPSLEITVGYHLWRSVLSVVSSFKAGKYIQKVHSFTGDIQLLFQGLVSCKTGGWVYFLYYNFITVIASCRDLLWKHKYFAVASGINKQFSTRLVYTIWSNSLPSCNVKYITFNPLLINECKMVSHTITILQYFLQICYCVCDHFVFIGKVGVKFSA